MDSARISVANVTLVTFESKIMIIINRNLQIIYELIMPECAVIFTEANPRAVS